MGRQFKKPTPRTIMCRDYRGNNEHPTVCASLSDNGRTLCSRGDFHKGEATDHTVDCKYCQEVMEEITLLKLHDLWSTIKILVLSGTNGLTCRKKANMENNKH